GRPPPPAALGGPATLTSAPSISAPPPSPPSSGRARTWSGHGGRRTWTSDAISPRSIAPQPPVASRASDHPSVHAASESSPAATAHGAGGQPPPLGRELGPDGAAVP